MKVVSVRWGLKDSLLRYVESIPDGEIAMSAPATREGGEFVFPLGEDSPAFDSDSVSGELNCLGQVLLSGHWGAMRIALATPRVVLRHGEGELLVAQLGLFDQRSHFPVATLSQRASDSPTIFDATLTAEGRALLGQQYEVGQVLSPVHLGVAV